MKITDVVDLHRRTVFRDGGTRTGQAVDRAVNGVLGAEVSCDPLKELASDYKVISSCYSPQYLAERKSEARVTLFAGAP